MNILILDDSNDRAISEKLVKELSQKKHRVECLDLGNLEIAYCKGCFDCWLKTPGICVIDDSAKNIARKIIGCDALITLTPITFGCYSTNYKKVLERMIPILLPTFKKYNGEVHHPFRYNRFPSYFTVGILPSPDNESEKIFHKLVDRNVLNMRPLKHSVTILYPGNKDDKIAGLIDEIK